MQLYFNGKNEPAAKGLKPKVFEYKKVKGALEFYFDDNMTLRLLSKSDLCRQELIRDKKVVAILSSPTTDTQCINQSNRLLKSFGLKSLTGNQEKTIKKWIKKQS